MKNTRKLLDLDGKDIEKELAKIIAESPKSYKPNRWTEKELQILTVLYKANVSHKVIAEKLGRSVQAVDHQIHYLIL